MLPRDDKSLALKAKCPTVSRVHAVRDPGMNWATVLCGMYSVCRVSTGNIYKDLESRFHFAG